MKTDSAPSDGAGCLERMYFSITYRRRTAAASRPCKKKVPRAAVSRASSPLELPRCIDFIHPLPIRLIRHIWRIDLSFLRGHALRVSACLALHIRDASRGSVPASPRGAMLASRGGVARSRASSPLSRAALPAASPCIRDASRGFSVPASPRCATSVPLLPSAEDCGELRHFRTPPDGGAAAGRLRSPCRGW